MYDYSFFENNLIYQFNTEHELLDSIEELNRIFTQERSRLVDYTKSERLVAAYTLFYATTNMPKLQFVLDKASHLLEELSKLPVVDIGTGPGTYLLAWREFFNGKHGALFGVERSAVMRKQANKLLQNHAQISESLPNVSGGILLFGNAANEMSVEDIRRIIKSLSPRYILFIEPGTKELFNHFQPIRNSLLIDYKILYPCPVSGRCALGGNEGDDWCHQVVLAKHEIAIERICQKLHKDRRSLPVLFHLFGLGEKDKVDVNTLLFRRPLRTKFGFELTLCKGISDKNQLIKKQLLNRHFTKDVLKKVDKLSAGDFPPTELGNFEDFS